MHRVGVVALTTGSPLILDVMFCALALLMGLLL